MRGRSIRDDFCPRDCKQKAGQADINVNHDCQFENSVLIMLKITGRFWGGQISGSSSSFECSAAHDFSSLSRALFDSVVNGDACYTTGFNQFHLSAVEPSNRPKNAD